MLNNNWKNAIRAFLARDINDGNSAITTNFFGAPYTKNGESVLLTTGSALTSNWDNCRGSLNFENIGVGLNTSISSLTKGVVFGNGTAEPTANDYCLSGNIITTINSTSVLSISVGDDDSTIKTSVFTITNTGTDDITISEIGYIGILYSSSGRDAYLLDRTLLEEPVTIPAGGVGQITYTITLDVA